MRLSVVMNLLCAVILGFCAQGVKSQNYGSYWGTSKPEVLVNNAEKLSAKEIGKYQLPETSSFHPSTKLNTTDDHKALYERARKSKLDLQLWELLAVAHAVTRPPPKATTSSKIPLVPQKVNVRTGVPDATSTSDSSSGTDPTTIEVDTSATTLSESVNTDASISATSALLGTESLTTVAETSTATELASTVAVTEATISTSVSGTETDMAAIPELETEINFDVEIYPPTSNANEVTTSQSSDSGEQTPTTNYPSSTSLVDVPTDAQSDSNTVNEQSSTSAISDNDNPTTQFELNQPSTTQTVDVTDSQPFIGASNEPADIQNSAEPVPSSEYSSTIHSSEISTLVETTSNTPSTEVDSDLTATASAIINNPTVTSTDAASNFVLGADSPMSESMTLNNLQETETTTTNSQLELELDASTPPSSVANAPNTEMTPTTQSNIKEEFTESQPQTTTSEGNQPSVTTVSSFPAELEQTSGNPLSSGAEHGMTQIAETTLTTMTMTDSEPFYATTGPAGVDDSNLQTGTGSSAIASETDSTSVTPLITPEVHETTTVVISEPPASTLGTLGGNTQNENDLIENSSTTSTTIATEDGSDVTVASSSVPAGESGESLLASTSSGIELQTNVDSTELDFGEQPAPEVTTAENDSFTIQSTSSTIPAVEQEESVTQIPVALITDSGAELIEGTTESIVQVSTEDTVSGTNEPASTLASAFSTENFVGITLVEEVATILPVTSPGSVYSSESEVLVASTPTSGALSSNKPSFVSTLTPESEDGTNPPATPSELISSSESEVLPESTTPAGTFSYSEPSYVSTLTPENEANTSTLVTSPESIISSDSSEPTVVCTTPAGTEIEASTLPAVTTHLADTTDSAMISNEFISSPVPTASPTDIEMLPSISTVSNPVTSANTESTTIESSTQEVISMTSESNALENQGTGTNISSPSTSNPQITTLAQDSSPVTLPGYVTTTNINEETTLVSLISTDSSNPASTIATNLELSSPDSITSTEISNQSTENPSADTTEGDVSSSVQPTTLGGVILPEPLTSSTTAEFSTSTSSENLVGITSEYETTVTEIDSTTVQVLTEDVSANSVTTTEFTPSSTLAEEESVLNFGTTVGSLVANTVNSAVTTVTESSNAVSGISSISESSAITEASLTTTTESSLQPTESASYTTPFSETDQITDQGATIPNETLTTVLAELEAFSTPSGQNMPEITPITTSSTYVSSEANTSVSSESEISSTEAQTSPLEESSGISVTTEDVDTEVTSANLPSTTMNQDGQFLTATMEYATDDTSQAITTTSQISSMSSVESATTPLTTFASEIPVAITEGISSTTPSVVTDNSQSSYTTTEYLPENSSQTVSLPSNDTYLNTTPAYLILSTESETQTTSLPIASSPETPISDTEEIVPTNPPTEDPQYPYSTMEYVQIDSSTESVTISPPAGSSEISSISISTETPISTEDSYHSTTGYVLDTSSTVYSTDSIENIITSENPTESGTNTGVTSTVISVITESDSIIASTNPPLKPDNMYNQYSTTERFPQNSDVSSTLPSNEIFPQSTTEEFKTTQSSVSSSEIPLGTESLYSTYPFPGTEDPSVTTEEIVNQYSSTEFVTTLMAESETTPSSVSSSETPSTIQGTTDSSPVSQDPAATTTEGIQSQYISTESVTPQLPETTISPINSPDTLSTVSGVTEPSPVSQNPEITTVEEIQTEHSTSESDISIISEAATQSSVTNSDIPPPSTVPSNTDSSPVSQTVFTTLSELIQSQYITTEFGNSIIPETETPSFIASSDIPPSSIAPANTDSSVPAQTTPSIISEDSQGQYSTTEFDVSIISESETPSSVTTSFIPPSPTVLTNTDSSLVSQTMPTTPSEEFQSQYITTEFNNSINPDSETTFSPNSSEIPLSSTVPAITDSSVSLETTPPTLSEEIQSQYSTTEYAFEESSNPGSISSLLSVSVPDIDDLVPDPTVSYEEIPAEVVTESPDPLYSTTPLDVDSFLTNPPEWGNEGPIAGPDGVPVLGGTLGIVSPLVPVLAGAAIPALLGINPAIPDPTPVPIPLPADTSVFRPEIVPVPATEAPLLPQAGFLGQLQASLRQLFAQYGIFGFLFLWPLVFLSQIISSTTAGRSFSYKRDYLADLVLDLSDGYLDEPLNLLKTLAQIFPEQFEPPTSPDTAYLNDFLFNIFPEQLEPVLFARGYKLPVLLSLAFPEKIGSLSDDDWQKINDLQTVPDNPPMNTAEILVDIVNNVVKFVAKKERQVREVFSLIEDTIFDKS